MVVMPSASASFGLWMWAGLPSQRISPSVGCQSPEIVLIVTDLPAPLSPDESGHLARRQGEVDLVEGLDGPEDLAHPPQLQERCTLGHRRSPLSPCQPSSLDAP